MGAFVGQLRQNEIFSAIYNMIISQQVFADNIGGGFKLVDKARVDGGLYGDTKLYYATDALKTTAWSGDSEASNLLALHRPSAPACQAISMTSFRKVAITVDNYLSKRAFSDEGAFSSFNSVMLGWLGETKAIYEETLYNAFIGTDKGDTTNGGTKQARTVNLDSASSGDPLYGLTGVDKAKMEAMLISQSIADLIIELKDVSRDFNDYKYLRSYNEDQIKVVWSSAWINKIRKVDIPTIIHKDGLVDKFDENVLPDRYFGDVVTSKVEAADNKAATYADHLRSLIETDYTVGGVTTHVFPGDQIPYGVEVAANTAYTKNAKVICKVLINYAPFMSAFETGTTFFNSLSLTNNHYLIWGHNPLEHLKNYPVITVSKK